MLLLPFQSSFPGVTDAVANSGTLIIKNASTLGLLLYPHDGCTDLVNAAMLHGVRQEYGLDAYAVGQCGIGPAPATATCMSDGTVLQVG